MAQQGQYPLNGRTLAATDTLTGVVTTQTADVPLSVLATFVSSYLGLGTMATQNANAVAITGGSLSGVSIVATSVSTSAATISGGSINSTPIGATTPSTGAFTTLSTTGLATLNSATISGGSINSTPIGATTPSTGAFTTLSTTGLATLASATITGGSINSTPIGATTASTGAFTTITASSTITPSQTAGIVGTTTNNNANAGSVGEFVSSNVPSGSAVALTSGSSANVTSISLTAGDWDVWGSVGITTGGSTVVSAEQGGINTVSATLPTFPGGGAQYFLPLTLPTGQGMLLPVGTVRLSLSATTTVYLVANFSFSTSTCSAYGFIGARRRR